MARSNKDRLDPTLSRKEDFIHHACSRRFRPVKYEPVRVACWCKGEIKIISTRQWMNTQRDFRMVKNFWGRQERGREGEVGKRRISCAVECKECVWIENVPIFYELHCRNQRIPLIRKSHWQQNNDRLFSNKAFFAHSFQRRNYLRSRKLHSEVKSKRSNVNSVHCCLRVKTWL